MKAELKTLNELAEQQDTVLKNGSDYILLVEAKEMADTYARIQIEKDRESIIAENLRSQSSPLAQAIRNKPIILD